MAIRAMIHGLPPRTLGYVLARAIIAAEQYSISTDGDWADDEVGDGVEVVLSLLQVAGMTDGHRMRGIANNLARV